MKRVLLVVDPILGSNGAEGVQYQLVRSLASRLTPSFAVSVYSPYCAADSQAGLRQAGCEVWFPRTRDFVGNRVSQRFLGANESMLWAESWIQEASLGRNSSQAKLALEGQSFDTVINASMTVPFPSNVWWIQGTPLDMTIEGMAENNLAARLVGLLGRSTIRRLDHRLFRRFTERSDTIIANSVFLEELYRSRGVAVDGVVLTLKDFGDYRPATASPSRDYVLIYVGKETDGLDLEALHDAGVRIVGFGNKIPAVTRRKRITDWIDFRGAVSEHELIRLYSNALFTLFPFSMEPLGWVPIESMGCGTPVLTYSRQGPATTVVDGKTGWLVKDAAEMLSKATELWNRKSTGISPNDCMRRADDFSVDRSASDLIRWIHQSSFH